MWIILTCTEGDGGVVSVVGGVGGVGIVGGVGVLRDHMCDDLSGEDCLPVITSVSSIPFR